MEFEMKMPDLATTGSAMMLIRWLAKPGEPVQRGQKLLKPWEQSFLSISLAARIRLLPGLRFPNSH